MHIANEHGSSGISSHRKGGHSKGSIDGSSIMMKVRRRNSTRSSSRKHIKRQQEQLGGNSNDNDNDNDNDSAGSSSSSSSSDSSSSNSGESVQLYPVIIDQRMSPACLHLFHLQLLNELKR